MFHELIQFAYKYPYASIMATVLVAWAAAFAIANFHPITINRNK